MEACPLSIRANLWRRMNSPIDQCVPPLSGGRVLLLFIGFNANIHHRPYIACARRGTSPQFRRQFHIIDVQKSSVSSHCKAPTRDRAAKRKSWFAFVRRLTVSAATTLCHVETTQPPFCAENALARSPMKFVFSHNASALILHTKWGVPTPSVRDLPVGACAPQFSQNVIYVFTKILLLPPPTQKRLDTSIVRSGLHGNCLQMCLPSHLNLVWHKNAKFGGSCRGAFYYNLARCNIVECLVCWARFLFIEQKIRWSDVDLLKLSANALLCHSFWEATRIDFAVYISSFEFCINFWTLRGKFHRNNRWSCKMSEIHQFILAKIIK